KGDLIAFSGRDEHRVFDLYTVAVAGGKVTRLTQSAGTNEKPAWAPNGRYLLFSSTRNGKRQIWMTQPEGSNQRLVTTEKIGASDAACAPLPPKLTLLPPRRGLGARGSAALSVLAAFLLTRALVIGATHA